MGLHSCELKLISTFDHRSFPSRGILPPTSVMLNHLHGQQQSTPFVNLRDMMDAEKLSSAYGRELEDEEMLRALVCNASTIHQQIWNCSSRQ